MQYNIPMNATLYLYIHQLSDTNFNIPITGLEVFVNQDYINISDCQCNEIQYNISVLINEQELYKYNPSDEYYFDNCSYMGELSLYERKQEYNQKNLSLCQNECNFKSYNHNTKSVICLCSPKNSYINKNEELLHKFALVDEDRDKCVIIHTDAEIEETEQIKICDIYSIFNDIRECKINLTAANKEIIEGLNSSSTYREFLLDYALGNETQEGNEKFSIERLDYDNTIQLYECEVHIRIYYNLTDSEKIYIYKHEINIPFFNIPIINFEIFNRKVRFNMSICHNIVIGYNIPVNININELYKDNPSDEYYSDNCSYMGELSLYERKQEYNEKNLSLCQNNCKYDNYNNNTKSVTCKCIQRNSNENNELDKFELKEDDKYKCKIFPSDNITNNITNITEEKSFFEEIINKIIANKTGKEKAVVFEDMIKGITNGSLDTIIEQIINDKKDFVMTVDSDTYHLSTVKQQFLSKELSAVDLGDCEDEIRSEYSLGDQELLIFKVDHYVPTFNIPIIEYVLFSEDGKININLDICKDIPINYYIPVNISGDQLYLYDPNNEFYNDKCHTHTSEGGTDMTLFDRKNEYNIQNMSLCENGCQYEGYNETTLKTKCTCPIKTQRNFFEIDPNKLLNKFKNYKDMINIMIIKCYKLVFSSAGLKKNIGSYVIISFAITNIILITIFYTKGFTNLKNTMTEILNKSFKEKNEPPKKEKNKRKSVNTKKVDIVDNSRENTKEQIIKKSKTKTDNKKGKKKKKEKKGEEKKGEEEKGGEEKGDEIIYMNDYELNSLSYDDALIYEKRTYWEYYISLIKTKQLIVFTFYTKTDYNSRLLKIMLFLISFALFYTVNALFFNDSTMHQIYEDKGAFNFVYQIPQILYSAIISTVIKMIITFLSLTEKNFIAIKSKKSKKLALQELDNILKCIAKKCLVFFILSFLLIILFWYYLACFCAVYKNTQTYLIKDTLISFATSLLYPFAINLIPGLLRMPALKHKKKCLYIISTIVAII